MSTAGSPGDRKLNLLLREWPYGAVVTQRRLNELGVYRQLVSKYARYAWVEKIGTGAYVRAGDAVDWRGGLFALQTELRMTAHIGAETALTYLGFAHFIPLGARQRVLLVSNQSEQLPAWFRQHPWKADLIHHCLALFERIPNDASSHLDCHGFRVTMSSAERAIMEQLRLAQTNDEISHAIELMSGLVLLRPHVVQALLEACRSIKVKRLFLWSAEAAGHSWLDRLDLRKVTLGAGKRLLYKGGRLDTKYGITVPRSEEVPDV
jgi:hypothetical protein